MRLIKLLLILTIALTTAPALAKSALSPRHSGIEPPDSPRPTNALPGSSPSRTAEGGMGYADAYGNTVRRDEAPEPPAKPKRLRPGAFGVRDGDPADNRLPDPAADAGSPWKFR